MLVAALWLAIAGAQVLQKVPPRLGYLLYLPKRTWSSHKKWPLILYLHGKSLRGNDLSKVSKYGLPKRLLTDRGFPFIVVCPQLPADRRWTDTRAMAQLVKDISQKYPVDRSRVYAAGFSMGASGVWRVAHDSPGVFAAIISIGGMYEKPLVLDGKMKGATAWIIHGTNDTEASEAAAREFYKLFVAKGGKGRYTPLPGKGHNIPTVLEGSGLYKWLLAHQLRRQKVKMVRA
jgi:predicted peptidase